MPPTPTPLTVAASEEWLDADFDIPEGEPIHASDVDSDKEDEEDWDMEMDLGKTGGARVNAGGLESTLLKGLVAVRPTSGLVSRMHTIRPPLQTSVEEDEEDESVPTIKAASLLGMSAPPPPLPPPAVASSGDACIDDDFEDGFALPSDLTRLSLRPLDLAHRSSKSSMEWGDKDHTTSSQSSDTYSTFGFADHSPPSTAYTSASSVPDTEEEDEDIEDDLLDGLVVPSGLFESGQSGKKLTKILETKKKTVSLDMRVKVARPDPEDDFETGLVLDDETELSPSRLLLNSQSASKRVTASPVTRSKSPPQTLAIRPSSRSKTDRAKSPNNPPISSVKQFRKLNAPPSPPRPTSTNRTPTYSQAVASSVAPSGSSLTSKAVLRGQKSHSGLKPVSAPPVRQLTRKASMPSLSDKGTDQPSASGTLPNTARYNAPTASSRAKAHSSASRAHALEFGMAPVRPTTPSSNSAALRLTMPTASSRMKSRTPISSVFPTPTSARPTSPIPLVSRPPSSSSNKASAGPSKVRHKHSQSLSGVPTAKVLKRPKRQRTYGDGTELDDFEDLPLDREKEGKFRVVPKGYGNRVPESSSPGPKVDSQPEQGSLRRAPRYDSLVAVAAEKPMPPPTKTLKRTSRIELVSAPKPAENERVGKKRRTPKSPASQSHRKPTLIRNLGGAGGPKVVGDMKWNPQTLRWEGNDQVLRDFDATVGTSTRPALITHLTGSSMGSPVNNFAAGARKVGNMIFDPSRMCWVSTLPPEEDEPDVFANLADDEDSDDWESKADTIKATLQLNRDKDTTPTAPQIRASGSLSSRTRSRSESESDRGSRASMVCDVDDGFFDQCQAAEQRHRHEMRGWIAPTTTQSERAFLYEIRALATRQY
ncbi:hypothetical protein BC629DRAFT_1588563 [Irpex lacteus]|nr:hypothetical protein BC629DRAFT_1588563 [Irpex lacteus]